MRALRLVPVLILSPLIALAGCGGSRASSADDGGDLIDAAADAADAGGAIIRGKDAMVTAFDKTPIYFAGSDNRRTVDAHASFPAEGAYGAIILHLAVDCASGGCDPWDHFGTLGVVTHKGEDGGADTVIDVARFMTPCHVGASFDLDVTDLRPLLTGDLTLRAFIDTWVGPGSQYGGG